MATYRFFWIASEEYIPEARRSAASLLEHHPEADLTLFTDAQEFIEDETFSAFQYLTVHESEYWFLRSASYLEAALWHYEIGEKVVYLDTDTHICASLDGIFQALWRFDFLGAHAPGRSTAPTVNPIPDSFPEYNIGVNGFVVTSEMRRFLLEWLEWYQLYAEIYRNNDQAPFREAVWRYHGRLEFGTLPTEYNFRFGMGGQVRETVRVLHGRSADYENLKAIVNTDERNIRAWEKGKLR